MMKNKTKYGWDTQKEIAYIDSIGDSDSKKITRLPKKEYLKGYIAGLQRRVAFGAISKDVVLNYARMRLAELKRG